MTGPWPADAVVAVGAAALGAALLLRPRPRATVAWPASVRTAPGPPIRSRSPGWVLPAAGPVTVLGLAAVLGAGRVSVRSVVLALLVPGLAAAVRAGWRRRDRRRRQLEGQARVLDFCEQLASELGAGQHPGASLQRAAAGAAALEPVARAFRLGGDVPTALREAAGAPGQRDLRLVAAAWQVAHHSGAGLAAALQRVAAQLRSAAATRRVVRSELASARATGRLMAALPVLALAMGGTIGGDPLGFLFGSTGGALCLAGGLVLLGAGLAWIEAIADAVEGDRS